MPSLSEKSEFDILALMQLLLFIVVPEDVTARSFQPVLDENSSKIPVYIHIYTFTSISHVLASAA